MIIMDVEQGSKEWFALRAGIPSASNFSKIITTKGLPSKSAQKYMYTLAVERITGKKEDSFTSGAMQRGIDMETEARQLYEMLHNATAEEVGFCFKDEAMRFGCSPDALIGKDEGLEIKSPSASVHCEYLLKDKLPSTYFQQVQGSLFVTGLKGWNFMSYFPAVRPLMVKVQPDKVFIAKLDVELYRFCEELDKVVIKVKGE